MKRLTYITLISIILSYAAVPALAAVSKDVSPEQVISSVAEDRQLAKQEYEEYKAQKKLKKRAPVQIKVPMVSREEEAPYARSKDDIIIGTGLILAAIVLSVYLHQLTKKEQKA